MCAPQSIDYNRCLHFRPNTFILCHWSKYHLSQHLYFLWTVITPEREQGFCCWNHCHCFSITTLPNAHSSGLQSLWSLLELVPAEWTDWWAGRGVCVCVSGCECVYTFANQRLHLCCMFLNLLCILQSVSRLLNGFSKTKKACKCHSTNEIGNKETLLLLASPVHADDLTCNRWILHYTVIHDSRMQRQSRFEPFLKLPLGGELLYFVLSVKFRIKLTDLHSFCIFIHFHFLTLYILHKSVNLGGN